MDLSKIKDIEFDGIDGSDFPDFVDAYIIRATYEGQYLTDDELDTLNQDSGFVYEALMNYLY